MKLKQAQRAAFFAGERPKIVYPGDQPCPVTVGETYRLSRGWWIVVTDIKRTRKGEHVVHYQEHDERDKPRLLANQAGRRNAGQYVTSRGQALKGDPVVDEIFGGEPEAIPKHAQDEITKRAGMAHGQWKTLEDAQRAKDRELLGFEQRVKDARGQASITKASIQREMWMLKQMLAEGRSEQTVRRLETAERKSLRKAA